MVEFNENDFNLPVIRSETKLANLVTRYKYRVYGLRQEGNAPVLVEYRYNRVDEHFEEKLEALKAFLKQHGIILEVWKDVDTKGIDVGVRKDVRGVLNKNKKPMFAAGIVSTIIYCLEGRVDLTELQRYKLSVVPRLLPAHRRA